MSKTENRTVVIIGAGPSGSIASAILHQKGHDVVVIEKEQFPRFCIGESLLSHCLDFIEEAGMLDAVHQAGFQLKHGAAFSWGDRYTEFDFRQGFTSGKGTTFEVPRGDFDKLLADQAVAQGVEIRYQHTVQTVNFEGKPLLHIRTSEGDEYDIQADFVLDASGYGRVLPRLLSLETPSNLPPRRAVFTHIEDNITSAKYNREKILITTHPVFRDVWFWLIPFSNGRASIGVVGLPERYEGYPEDLGLCLQQFVHDVPHLKEILANAKWDTPFREIKGYSANVKTLCGDGFALLGNAAEFLDPVFSSGVTIAMRSASMAAGLLDRQLKGELVNWQQEFAQPLMVGVNTFRTYVEGWYNGTFQDVIFYEHANEDIRKMVCSILAGYAWDMSNPFVADAKRKLDVVYQLCQ
ncbi:NAD(P)/FAD-dependent oxidoreductase [Neisseria sp. Ec49-e6-T10]